MFEYAKGYVEAGNDRLAVYRDSERPTFVAAEFKSMIDRLPELGEHLPDLKAYLLGFPKVTIPDATSFLYWQEAKFGLKPTIRINHVVIDDRPGADRDRQQADVRLALLLDRAGRSRAGPRSLARSRLLVRQGHAQPIGRPRWLHREHDPRQGPERGAEGHRGRR